MGCNIGLLWFPSLSWWFILLSWMTSLMNGTFRTSCKVWLVTYRGAFMIIRSILDWLRCILAICDLLAHPHSSIPLVQISFMIVLYRSTLLYMDAGDFLRLLLGPCILFCVYAVLTSIWNPNGTHLNETMLCGQFSEPSFEVNSRFCLAVSAGRIWRGQ
jgi:hypothetical protein